MRRALVPLVLAMALLAGCTVFGGAPPREPLRVASWSGWVDREGWYNVVGEVENDAATTQDAVRVHARALAPDGTLVTSDETGLRTLQALAPGERAAFHLRLPVGRAPVGTADVEATGQRASAAPLRNDAMRARALGPENRTALGGTVLAFDLVNTGDENASAVVQVVFRDAEARVVGVGEAVRNVGTDPVEPLAPRAHRHLVLDPAFAVGSPYAWYDVVVLPEPS